ncbi:MAG: hypothetical protein MGG11_14745 [Trichodesmium sp. MAG_R03]|nr:hypothetical protein [Trichodesmium sp. MAG_R03]
MLNKIIFELQIKSSQAFTLIKSKNKANGETEIKGKGTILEYPFSADTNIEDPILFYYFK